MNRGHETVDPDVMGLRLLALYGLKGAAAYMEHARVLGQTEEAVFAEYHQIMSWLGSEPQDSTSFARLLDANRFDELQNHGNA